MKKKIILIGGGGHARVVADALSLCQDLTAVGYVAPEQNELMSKNIKYLGNDSVLPQLLMEGLNQVICAVGSIGQPDLRNKIIANLESLGFEFISIIHPKAIIGANVKIGQGVFIAAGVVVNCGANISDHVVLNTHASIDHDCQLGRNVQIAPGVVLGGTVVVGKDSFIGLGAKVIQNIKIGRNCFVGAGSVVIKDVAAQTKVWGVPAKKDV